MKKILTILSLLLVVFCQNVYSQISDSLITSILSKVNADTLKKTMLKLESCGTRYLLAENRFNSADMIYNQFKSYGIQDVHKDSFACRTDYFDTTTNQINIIATIPGSVRPEEVIIIGAHYDCVAINPSLTTALTIAPGADDNASGTAGVLELARVIISSGYKPDVTIKFIAFAAEELMLFGDAGSEYFALKAKNAKMNIKLMINLDMIANSDNALQQTFQLNYYDGCNSTTDLAKELTKKFTSLNVLDGGHNDYGDSRPFWENGVNAIYYEELVKSPFYHKIKDSVIYCNMNYCKEIVKAAGSLLLYATENITGINDENIVNQFSLMQNYPNPFNPITTINYNVAKAEHISIKVYNVLGKEICTLVNEVKPSGTHKIIFDASSLSSGIYIYKMVSGKYFESKKMTLLK